MELLSRRFIVTTLPDLLRRTALGETGLAAITFDDGYRDVYERAFPIMLRLDLRFTIFVTTQLIVNGQCDWLGNHSSLASLTWAQLREMQAHGADIGGHTHTHQQWLRQSSDEISNELKLSKDILNEKLGPILPYFAYPFGQPHDLDGRGTTLLPAAGFISGFTTLHTSIDSVRNPFQIPRLSINAEDSVEDFRQNINGQRDVLSRIETVRSALRWN